MKSTGIVRKVDELGRVVIPIELRKRLNIEEETPLEIWVKNDEIVLRKYLEKKCSNCGQAVEGIDKYCRRCGEVLNGRNSRRIRA